MADQRAGPWHDTIHLKRSRVVERSQQVEPSETTRVCKRNNSIIERKL